MNKQKEFLPNLIKIILSVLFLICLLNMPYGYYQLVRFLALVGFAILANYENRNGNQTSTIVYISLAILFQPLYKITLGREIWNLADVIVAIGLIASIFFTKKDVNSAPSISKKG